MRPGWAETREIRIPCCWWLSQGFFWVHPLKKRFILESWGILQIGDLQKFKLVYNCFQKAIIDVVWSAEWRGFEGQKIHQQIAPNIERNEIKAWMNGQISLEMPPCQGFKQNFGKLQFLSSDDHLIWYIHSFNWFSNWVEMGWMSNHNLDTDSLRYWAIHSHNFNHREISTGMTWYSPSTPWQMPSIGFPRGSLG